MRSSRRARSSASVAQRRDLNRSHVFSETETETMDETPSLGVDEEAEMRVGFARRARVLESECPSDQ